MQRGARVLALLSLVGPAACGDDAERPRVSVDGAIAGVELVGRYEMNAAADFDISDDGRLAAVSGWFDGTVHLVDVSDPAAPRRITALSVGYNADVQFAGTTLYIAHEDRGDGSYPGFGVGIMDVSDPEHPSQVSTLSSADGDPGLDSCHNLWPPPDRALLFCASTATGQIVILSTGEMGGSPQAPVVIGALSHGASHDMFSRGDRLYSAWLWDGFTVHDLSDPSAPVILDQVSYPDAVTHNIWPDSTGTLLFSTDETAGGHVRVWNAADESAIAEIGAFQPVPTAVSHDVEVVDDTLFIAHYTAGLLVADLADPREPHQLAIADFYDGPDDYPGEPVVFAGAWGVEARPPLVYVSGTDSGLWIYRLLGDGNESK